MIIDTPLNVTSKLSCLVTQNVQVIIRYYNFSNSMSFPDKCMTLAEAEAIAAQGIKIAVVFQQRQNQAADFSKSKGIIAGTRAYRYAQDNIGQPPGSAIYFSVDFDASNNEIENNIIPFFEGVNKAFSDESAGNPEYRVGAYGSGLTCKTLIQKNLSEFTWLAMSRGFNGTMDALNAGEFHLAQRLSPSVCGLDCDINDTNPAQPDFGAFILDNVPLIQPQIAATGQQHKVIARHGLRLREGPGAQFDIIGNLRPGQIVFVSSVTDGFARIDVDGDGQVDGFASSGFLETI